MHLGISTGGHYLSEDGGETFAASNRGIAAAFLPDPYPEFGQCVHKIASHPDTPERLYMQNHGGFPEHPGIGVLRSDDYGHTWRPIAAGLPSDFGLPILTHPHDPDTVYVMPLEAMTRTCGGAPAVWRSQNGGGSWNRLDRGLPEKESYFTVLRDAMDIDRLASPAPSEPRPANSGSVGTVGRIGAACSIRSRRSTASRPRWCNRFNHGHRGPRLQDQSENWGHPRKHDLQTWL